MLREAMSQRAMHNLKRKSIVQLTDIDFLAATTNREWPGNIFIIIYRWLLNIVTYPK